MTGNISSGALLERVRDVVAEMKKANPEVVYVCDPVMRDHGFLYVPADLVPIYKRDLLPMADSDAKSIRKRAVNRYRDP